MSVAERQSAIAKRDGPAPRPTGFTDGTIYEGDPLAKFLVMRLKMGSATLALVAIGWSLVYLFVWPSVLGYQRTSGTYLGSLDDWHAQLLLLLVFPVSCAFYLWQPKAMARVYRAILAGQRFPGVGRLYHKSAWRYLSIFFALAIVLFDVPKMVADYGSWWMAHDWLTIAGREASLSLAFYMLSMMAWRQLVATWEWRHLLEGSWTPAGVRSATRYGLSCAFLLALFGLRLSIEGIELPQRSGALTPDYYVKIGLYVAVTLTCFLAPICGVSGDRARVRLDWLGTLLELAGIMALPLVGFVLLRVALGT